MKRVISLIVIGVLLFSTVGIMAGCNKDVYVEGKEWNYYKLRRGKDGVALTRLNDESLIVDGVLTIPTKVDGYRVTMLTGKRAESKHMWSSGSVFSAGSADQLIIPKGIKVDKLFWNGDLPQTIIFMDENPDIILTGELGVLIYIWGRGTIVVPDGTYEAYYPKFYRSIEQEYIYLIEYTEFKNK